MSQPVVAGSCRSKERWGEKRRPRLLARSTGAPSHGQCRPRRCLSRHRSPRQTMRSLSSRLSGASATRRRGCALETTRRCQHASCSCQSATWPALTETHRVRVVTHFVQGHGSDTDDVPAKTVDQLKPGDFVVFRTGTEGDIIRGYADLWLKKQRMGHMRDVAGLWRKALQEFRTANGGAGRSGLNRTVALLKAGGGWRGASRR